ncbi:hydroxyacylglutathione hydrolase [Cryptococcus deuterogattii 99/473]|uniref:hydroxyacylglutathione hydrolase n=1 Tax=Cryptococcus deuterogattii Ram5 TaxID=1296110 RepID=A0A0D0T9Q5_9TREE|nr:hydroxyacylglutathione hydrolase [Cryptococcus deuterogattii LA55]KIR42767.1 hydroxyacylglutathione hydrolase [Cryptococcus deuterogattii Ram5]KIR95648.1 hydroxyacylglutathione hydrolase [Cryptococcus deuterogattii CBS 10090]KIS02144.1 hydroxyacylglutathione hydrolase [Cryptococcus deuterogattii 2001/935-1]KIY59448.1 hydroxyacylglutathione hydrolase [Cryptococcus deuterogattii 99/473]
MLTLAARISAPRFSRQFSTSFISKMKVLPYQARSDNWMYLIIDSSNEAAVVDPYDASKISNAIKEQGVNVTSLITTHHHADHSGGNSKFLSLHPNLKTYAGSTQSPGTNTVVKDGDTFTLGQDITVKCLHTPCHTQDSICFFLEDKKTGQRGVFTGDTLFLAGCGRFFEGTPEEMHAALNKLSNLPEDTVVYNGHEYTKGSAKFGLMIEPDNQHLKELLKKAENDSCTTGKSTIRDEKNWNVFMRLDTPQAKQATGKTEAIQIMGRLREMKNAM